MSSKIPYTAQTTVSQTLTTTTAGASIDLAGYDYAIYSVTLAFAGGTSSIGLIETSSDNATFTPDLGKTTPATTGTGSYTYLVDSTTRYVRVRLTTVGGATVTVSVKPVV